MRQSQLVLLALLLTVAATTGASGSLTPAQVPTWQAQSSATQVQRVSLYTSQGCSSCPPADAWLSKFRTHEGLWAQWVPVAYHVTYWNYLGWADPFARSENDKRQRAQARLVNAGVYTPGVFRNGQEWRGWRRGDISLSDTNSPLVGVLQASATNGIAQIKFDSSVATLQQPYVEIALLSIGEQTAVAAGENRGRQLHHDFVSVADARSPLAHNGQTWTTQLSLPAARAQAVAISVFNGDGHFVQTTGTWIEPPDPAPKPPQG